MFDFCDIFLKMKIYLRYILFVFLFCVPFSLVYSEGNIQYRASLLGGFFMKDGKVDPWVKGPVLGGEVAVEFLPTGKWQFLQNYNNATMGVSLSFFDFGNNKMLGQAIAPAAYIHIPFINHKKVEWGISAGIGIGFNTKRYINTVSAENRYKSIEGANQSIGSVVNLYLPEVMYLRVHLTDSWTLGASFGWYHFSNGSIKLPNSGYNIFMGELGVTYRPKADKYVAPEKRVPRKLYDGKRWDVEISATGGFRQAYYRDKGFFGCATVSVSAHWRPVSIFKLGGGIDMFYDDYYRSVNVNPQEGDRQTLFRKTWLEGSEVKNCFRVGISLQPEFVFGNFTCGFHFGVYLYDNIKNLEPYKEVEKNGKPFSRGIFYSYDIANAGSAGHADGWLYTRIVLKYRVTKHLFVQAGLKAHLTKAEFIDAGLGVAL